MEAAPGVNPRSYVITINEKYDSPDFKNAEEKLTVDIPVNQHSRLSVSNFELTPESIEVGRESNIMFGINNTGKVLLYNVQAIFEDPSIKKTSAYVGNIKPGETGNVDVMLTGVAPSTGDGTIPIVIQYEDVNGNISSMEQSCTLTVTEPVPEEPVDMDGMDMNVPSSSGPKKLLPLALAVIVAAAGAVFAIRRRRKKKDEENNTDEDADEGND